MKKTIYLGIFALLAVFTLSGCTSAENVSNSAATTEDTNVNAVNSAVNTNESMGEESTSVSLLYYNQTADEANTTLEACHPSFVQTVATDMTYPDSTLEEIFTAQFENELTEEQLAEGFVRTPFDAHDFSFDSVVLEEGMITVNFSDDTLMDSLSDCEGSILVSVFNGLRYNIPAATGIRTSDDRILIDY